MFSNASMSISLLEKITIDDINRYAQATGWTQIADPLDELAILRRDDNANFEIVLAKNSDYTDYFDLLKSALFQFAHFEHRPVGEILDDLLLPLSDLLTFSLIGDSTESGTIPLNDGLDLIDGIKRALAATACSILKPQRYHPRLFRNEVEQFLSNCRISPPQNGSFVAPIYCSVERLPFEEWHSPGEETFGRKITRTLIENVHLLAEISLHEDLEAILTVNETISSNLCDALLKMQPEGKRSSLAIAARWEKSTSSKTPSVGGKPLLLRKDVFPIIEQVSLSLRKQKHLPKNEVLVAKVAELKGQTNSDGKMEGDVIIHIFTDEDEVLKAKVNLTPANYISACDAHRDSDFVMVVGELHRHTRLHEIKDCRVFEILRPNQLGHGDEPLKEMD